MHVEAVGASGGQFSARFGAAVQVTGAVADCGASMPGPNGSFGPSGGVVESTATTRVNAGVCAGYWVGMADGEGAGLLASGRDIKTGVDERARALVAAATVTAPPGLVPSEALAPTQLADATHVVIAITYRQNLRMFSCPPPVIGSARNPRRNGRGLRRPGPRQDACRACMRLSCGPDVA